MRGASAAKALRRSTADRLLEELLSRILQLNANTYFLARVERAIVFGSYLSEADRLGDVDIAILWEPRETDRDKHREANAKRVRVEMDRGRSFSNIVEELFWWQREAMLFLRNRKRGLSLHDYRSDKEAVEAGPNRIIFPQ